MSRDWVVPDPPLVATAVEAGLSLDALRTIYAPIASPTISTASNAIVVFFLPCAPSCVPSENWAFFFSRTCDLLSIGLPPGRLRLHCVIGRQRFGDETRAIIS